MPGARVYRYRMFDLVTDRKTPSFGRGDNTSLSNFFSMAFDLIDSINLNVTKTDNDDKNFKILSPRIAPILPERTKKRHHLLSPSILPLYSDDSADSIAPLPEVLKATGISEKDRDAILEMVMDISGAKRSVEGVMEILKGMNFVGFESEVLEATERLTKLFKNLEKSFNKWQRKDMKQRGFTFLERNQLQKLFREHGIKNGRDVNFDLDSYSKLSKSDREESLWQTIERIAYNRSVVDSTSNTIVANDNNNNNSISNGNNVVICNGYDVNGNGSNCQNRVRTKRQTEISVLQPTVLSPFMFTPVTGLTVLGPTVLSPSIFSVLLVNPSVVSPYVMSPAFILPFILSPYLLSPYVLSPIFAAPFVLSPYFLSPNVLNPYIFSPLILSPMVLAPDVISPQAFGGAILSPSVLSPSVLTETVLMASVLSPSFLS
ncbi:unnamed protein product [Anisakis simplex]|uniref:Uncharacterized protein n=1 Tax=Anisakis simplex TaxID=6269 RepID=A0A0M3K935_ANISI|nr:unnamed protein product [Anisakis simplex]